MKVDIFKSKTDASRKAASDAAVILRKTINKEGQAVMIVATGASQFDVIKFLVAEKGIDWKKVILFHLDEYIGMKDSHPASFRRYLIDRLISKLPGLKECHLVLGDSLDPEKECQRLNKIISRHAVDITFAGFGENGHLAFNDPPANFDIADPYIIVNLDLACRKQQMGEGWFKSIDEVPQRAISMSIKQIMKSKNIFCTVPDKRKAEAVRNCLENPVSEQFPASILQQHEKCNLYLDTDSSSLLTKKH
jgi:glucosamine-6-phosphate deaminase